MMTNNKKATFLFTVLFLFLVACEKETTTYVCTPCDLPCDTLTFYKDGICPHCNMPLIMKVDDSSINKVEIKNGSGNFLLEGGSQQIDKTIKVFYHKPRNFNSESSILLVIPGAGRNGDTYRDAWVETAEKHSLLILSPMYAEKEYDFGAYHMAGIIKDVELKNNTKSIKDGNVSVWDIRDEDLSFTVNKNIAARIFSDFDRIFDAVVKSVESNQTSYDIFGHSAGGQILHRMTLFYPDSKANRIIASNSGFYTLPDFQTALPFGIQGTELTEESLRKSFQKKLLLLIGELDNAAETRGTILHTPTVDQQGLHRLARGKYFYKTSKATAEKMEADFNWALQIVPGVGHDQRKIGAAAAKYLYE